MSKKSFTLVELMIVIAILAILSAIVLFALNPIRLFDNFRDTRRVADINTINKAINFVETWNTNGISYGSTSIVYISLPDTSSTCSSYSLPTLPTGYTYSCKTQANYRKVDSTGWIPIDFSINQSNSYLNVLPIDPVNDTTYFYTYYSGGSYEVTALLKNPNTNSINDDDTMTGAYALGSPNRSWNTPLQRDKNLSGYWKFDEGTGTIAYDYSGNNNTATWSGTGTHWITLSSGEKASIYNGADDYLTIANSSSLAITTSTTISAWVSASTSTTYLPIWSGTTGGSNGPLAISMSWDFRLYIDSVMRYAESPNNSLPVNTFQHVVCTYDGSEMALWLNGIKQTPTSITGLIIAGTTSKNIGKMGSAYKWNGTIDEVRIYSRALNSEEINTIYNKTKNEYQ